ncbi:MAG: phospholipase D-like domain-containing protein [Bacteriovoracaceae bacterium]|nr:phospholipase D-like domain-containing protein [Bacteriovoracaceae bacterium]
MSIDQFFISNISKDINHEESIKDILISAINVVVVAPFITKYGIDLIRRHISDDTKLQIITELNPRGIISVSQSPKLLKEISERPKTEVFFTTNGKLHSKIFLADNNVLITSANLTTGGMRENFETGVLFSKKSESKFSGKLKDEIISHLRNDLIPYIKQNAFKLDDSSIAIWLDFENSEKVKQTKDFINDFENNLPQNGFLPFSRNFDGRPVSTEILASINDFQFEEKYWDVFYRYNNTNDIDKLREDLNLEINPILNNIFHCIKQNPLCSGYFTNLTTMFSRNLQVTKFLPDYRNLYLTRIGLGGNNRKKHVYYPSFVLNMSIYQNEKYFQIRVGVEEDISTDPLCDYAKIFLKNLSLNSNECISRFKKMSGSWFLVHGQQSLGKRIEIPLKDVSEEKLKEICNSYLMTNEPADINICHNYLWSSESILNKPKDFISSLASDLNHLNYFFELAHYEI